MAEKLVIIGGTAAGLSAASKARRLQPDLEIVVFEKSKYVSYGSCGLPYFIGDIIKDAQELISLTVAELKERRKIDVYTEHEVRKINRDERTVTVSDATGREFTEAYDYLLIATGARPLMPFPEAASLKNVFTLRQVEDGIAIKNALAAAGSVVIVGAGFIGLEVAEQAALAGKAVTLVEAFDLLPRYPRAYAAELAATLQAHHINLRLNRKVVELKTAAQELKAVKLADGEELTADIYIFALGVLPNSELAVQSGLKSGIKGAIVTDTRQRTSDERIFAAGDCCQTFNIVSRAPAYVPLGTTANKQGKVAGAVIGGEEDSFEGILGSAVTKVFDTYIASTGLTVDEALAAGYAAAQVGIIKNDKASYYPGGSPCNLTLVFDKDSGVILGAFGMGPESICGRINTLAAAVTGRLHVKQLAQADLLYAPPVAPVYDPILIAATQACKLLGI